MHKNVQAKFLFYSIPNFISISCIYSRTGEFQKTLILICHSQSYSYLLSTKGHFSSTFNYTNFNNRIMIIAIALFYICFKKGKLKNMCVNNNNNFKKLHYQTFITIFTNSSVLKFVYANF